MTLSINSLTTLMASGFNPDDKVVITMEGSLYCGQVATVKEINRNGNPICTLPNGEEVPLKKHALRKFAQPWWYEQRQYGPFCVVCQEPATSKHNFGCDHLLRIEEGEEVFRRRCESGEQQSALPRQVVSTWKQTEAQAVFDDAPVLLAREDYKHEPWYELKDGYDYCKACWKTITPEHLRTPEHAKRVWCFFFVWP